MAVARWLEKFVNHEMFALYMSQGYNLVHGYVVDARAIGRTDRSRALFEGLYLDEEVGSDARVGDIATLRFPLWPTDEVISAMGGTTPKEQAITGGQFLERPPFRGNGMVSLPRDPIAALMYIEPTVLRAGAQLIRHTPDDAPESVIATYKGPQRGWVPADDPTREPLLVRPNGLLGPQVRGRNDTRPYPADLVLSDDGAIVEAYVLDMVGTQLGSAAIPLSDVIEAGFMRTRVRWKDLPCLVTHNMGKEGFRVMSQAHDAYAAEAAGMRRLEAGVYVDTVPAGKLPFPEMSMAVPLDWPGA